MSADKVGIVIVSHSPDVAQGTADMVRQMVGTAVPLAHCGGNPDGGLGTDVAKIMAAIEAAWSEAGVALFVDLGGAETNSEMAIEMLPEERQGHGVVICNAPIVEGAVMAATEAAGGASLDDVRATAEEFRRERRLDSGADSRRRRVLRDPTGLHARPGGEADQDGQGLRRRDPAAPGRSGGLGQCQVAQRGDEAEGRRTATGWTCEPKAAAMRPSRSRPWWAASSGIR